MELDHIDNLGHTFWKCLCECGKTKILQAQSLKTGNTKSCGCKELERAFSIGDRFNLDWTATGIMLAMMIEASGYSYINGWYRGRWDEQEKRLKILREENANSFSRKSQPKTPKWKKGDF